MKKIIQFFKDSYAELSKVVWPSKDEVIASTKIVIISTVAVSYTHLTLPTKRIV